MGKPSLHLRGPLGFAGRRGDVALTVEPGDTAVPKLELSVFGPGGKMVSPERFRFDLSKRKLRLRVPELTLGSKLHPGANTDRPGLDPSQVQTTSLSDLSVEFDTASRRLRAFFTANIPDQYPGMVTPARVRLETTPIDPGGWERCEDVGVSGEASYSAAQMKFRVRLSCDQAGVRKALARLAKSENPIDVLKELPGIGIDADGAIRYLLLSDIPLLGKLLQTRFKVRLDPNIGKKRALAPGLDIGPLRLGLMNYRAYGIVPVPPGGLFSTAAVGWGLTQGSYGKSSATTLTLSGTPSISTAPFALNFYLYFEVHKVWRVANGIDFGLRLTVAPELREAGRISQVLRGAGPILPSTDEFMQEAQDTRRRQMLDPHASPAITGGESRPFMSVKAEFRY